MLFAIVAAALLLLRLSQEIADWLLGRWMIFRATRAHHAGASHRRSVP